MLAIWFISRKQPHDHESNISDIDNSGAAVNILSKKERRAKAKAEAKQARAAATQKEADNS
ncbi:hypothetical protein GCM10017709_25800 [Glutamicibacter nicotianae]